VTTAECVINISEGRNRPTIDTVVEAGGSYVLDVHTDPQHNRSVVTLGGPLPSVEEAARAVVAAAVATIDLRQHGGIHPRIGAADVVPFVPLSHDTADGTVGSEVTAARDALALWAGVALELPCFLYGPERTLPEVRRTAFHPLLPDTGPHRPHPTAGASAVGVRPVLIAYNVWITADAGGSGHPAPVVARSLAAGLRTPMVRTLGLEVDEGAQVSMNLIDAATASIAAVYDAVALGAGALGCSVLRAELVGLLPDAALRAIDPTRWAELDLSEDRTIEARLEQSGSPAR
jgi:glutamate formiminotransferase